MTVRQLHYTSCRDGRDGIDGFQVAAATAGLPPHLEQLGLPIAAYRPPPSAPLVPTPAEVAAFPVALGYRRFGDVAVVFRSAYLGTDFSGRQGNYFAHLLFLDKTDAGFSGRSPAESWDAEGWVSARVDSAELPALATVPAGPLADADRLHRLIRPLLPVLPGLLAAVVEVLAGHGRTVVVVADDAADVASLVTAVAWSLPRALAMQVSFITYTATPAGAGVVVAGTTPDVALPRGPGTTVVRMTQPDGAPAAGWAELLAAAWAAGPASVVAAVALAEDVRPPLGADELDACAAFARLAQLGPSPDALAGLTWALDRAPHVVTPDVWENAEQVVVEPGDVPGWAAVLRRPAAAGVGPTLTATYTRAALAAIATGVISDPWIPSRPDRTDTVVSWLAAVVADRPTLEMTRRVLAAAGHLGVTVPDATLRAVADLVIVPRLVGADEGDPQDGTGGIAAIRALPGAERLLALSAEQLEPRLADADLFDAAVAGLSLPAADLLLGAARQRPRCAAAAELALARAGRRDRVRMAVRHVDRADPASLRRRAMLLWPNPPPAADGLLLCRSFTPQLLGDSGLALRVLNRIVADSRSGALAPAAQQLARELAGEALTAVLPGPAADVAHAVAHGSAFHAGLAPSLDAEDRAATTAALADHVEPAVGRWTADAIATWLLAQHSAPFHSAVLHRLLSSGARLTVEAYRNGLGVVVAQADPSVLAAILPSVATAVAGAPTHRALLDEVCQEALRGRRSRDLVEVRRALLQRDPGVPPPAGTPDWPTWWDRWTAATAAGKQKTGGLRGLLGRLGTPGRGPGG